MDENLRKYLDGEVNVVVLECPVMLTREKLPNGMEYIRILPKINEEYMKLYGFWHNPKKRDDEPSIITIDENMEVQIKDKPPPKHTGGKKPYLMLMINEIEELRERGVKNVEELIGYIVCLGKYIEWNTGKLVHKKKRKKIPLQYKDLQEIYKCSNKKLNKMLNEFKEYGLLLKTEEGYFVSTKFVKKGKTKSKEAK